MPGSYVYEGSELDVFSQAWRWKAYWGQIIKEFVGLRVLEVGAGIGATTRLLCSNRQSAWLALEPDAQLAARMASDGRLPENCEIRVGSLEALSKDQQFDTVLYIDVLEHIADDRTELQRAADHLEEGGHLIVLAPAHQKLSTAFDIAIGHFRRYNRQTLLSLTPSGLRPHKVIYLDSVGLLASLGNRYVLKSRMPTSGQIRFWDTWMIPISRFLDPIVCFRLGKSILIIWQKGGDMQ